MLRITKNILYKYQDISSIFYFNTAYTLFLSKPKCYQFKILYALRYSTPIKSVDPPIKTKHMCYTISLQQQNHAKNAGGAGIDCIVWSSRWTQRKTKKVYLFLHLGQWIYSFEERTQVNTKMKFMVSFILLLFYKIELYIMKRETYKYSILLIHNNQNF